jgi:hypothetical protein
VSPCPYPTYPFSFSHFIQTGQPTIEKGQGRKTSTPTPQSEDELAGNPISKSNFAIVVPPPPQSPSNIPRVIANKKRKAASPEKPRPQDPEDPLKDLEYAIKIMRKTLPKLPEQTKKVEKAIEWAAKNKPSQNFDEAIKGIERDINKH